MAKRTKNIKEFAEEINSILIARNQKNRKCTDISILISRRLEEKGNVPEAMIVKRS